MSAPDFYYKIWYVQKQKGEKVSKGPLFICSTRALNLGDVKQIIREKEQRKRLSVDYIRVDALFEKNFLQELQGHYE